MRSALESLNKSYDLFMMLEQVDKQIAVIEKEQQFLNKAMENGHINHEAIVQHEFEKHFLEKIKIKEANEMMIDAYDDGKAYYDNYKKLVSKVKNDYFSRSSENLKEDMQRLAPRVSYLSLITKDVIELFNQKSAVEIF